VPLFFIGYRVLGSALEIEGQDNVVNYPLGYLTRYDKWRQPLYAQLRGARAGRRACLTSKPLCPPSGTLAFDLERTYRRASGRRRLD
jgi:hypothetical protein